MTRASVRDLKKGLRAHFSNPQDRSQLAAAQKSALALLERSIRFGHGRLAIQRLASAVRAGADIPPADLAYCINVLESARKSNERHPRRGVHES